MSSVLSHISFNTNCTVTVEFASVVPFVSVAFHFSIPLTRQRGTISSTRVSSFQSFLSEGNPNLPRQTRHTKWLQLFQRYPSGEYPKNRLQHTYYKCQRSLFMITGFSSRRASEMTVCTRMHFKHRVPTERMVLT